MRNAASSECNGGIAKSGKILKVCNGDIWDQHELEMDLVYGFVDEESNKYVWLPPGKKIKTLCGGSRVEFHDGCREDLTFVEGEILEAVECSYLHARPGDLKKATGEVFGIDILRGIKVIVL